MGEYFEQHWITADRVIISWHGGEHSGSRELNEEEMQLLAEFNEKQDRQLQNTLRGIIRNV